MKKQYINTIDYRNIYPYRNQYGAFDPINRNPLPGYFNPKEAVLYPDITKIHYDQIRRITSPK